MSCSLTSLAPAKVNLNLHILNKNNAGYHLLDSLVVFTDFGDQISISKEKNSHYHMKGLYANSLKMDDDNLVVKAHRLMQQYTKQDLPCHITLTKNLPIAAGIGGGSSDGATTLKLLNQLFDLRIPTQTLYKLGFSLGADFPVCIYGHNCFMSGIGEKITPIHNFPQLYIGLINPNIAASTRDIFQLFNQQYSTPLKYQKSFYINQLFFWLKDTHNDLQNPAIQKIPQIKKILEKLSQTQIAYPKEYIHIGMSGSGSTCYILSPNPYLIKKALTLFNKNKYLTLSGKI